MEHIIYQLEEDLAILTLNRPEVANGFHIPMCEEILEALTLAEEDPAVHFVLINANGKVFSVGGEMCIRDRYGKYYRGGDSYQGWWTRSSLLDVDGGFLWDGYQVCGRFISY